MTTTTACRRLSRPAPWMLAALLGLLIGGCPQPAGNIVTGGSAPGGSTAGGSAASGSTTGTGAADSLALAFPGCEPAANADSLRAEVLFLVNQERSRRGLDALVMNATLQAQAEQYACEMIQYDFFAHENPVTGTTLPDRTADFGYDYRVIGENLAAGQPTPREVMDDWMNSPGHAANILDPRFTEIGIGVRTGGEFGIYWVQEFGQPRPANGKQFP